MRVLNMGVQPFSIRFGEAGPSDKFKARMQQAITVSQNSKDPSSKVGAVITTIRNRFISEDFNHFPPGVDESKSERWERPAKYSWIGHAEVNAILKAAKEGIALKGSRMFINWFPCTPCARAIVSSGIKELVGFTPDFNHPRWGEELKFAKGLLDEAKVKLTLFPESDFLKKD